MKRAGSWMFAAVMGICGLGGCASSAETGEGDVAASEDAYQRYSPSPQQRTCRTASAYETTSRAFQEIPELAALEVYSCERAQAVNMLQELDFRNCEGGGFGPRYTVTPGGAGYCPDFYRLASRIPQWFGTSVWNGGARFQWPQDESWRTVHVQR